MTDVEKSPQKSVLKRKIENESEDELFFQLENSGKKKVGKNETSNEEGGEDSDKKNKLAEKENKTKTNDLAKVNSPLIQQLLNKPATQKQVKLVQQKINFGSPTVKSPKIQLNDASNIKPVETLLKNKEVLPEVDASEETSALEIQIEKKSTDEWSIEDYLYDKEWKSLLSEEFNKKYFIEINKNIKDGYKKGINRPPKELVFNALNSTKISSV